MNCNRVPYRRLVVVVPGAIESGKRLVGEKRIVFPFLARHFHNAISLRFLASFGNEHVMIALLGFGNSRQVTSAATRARGLDFRFSQTGALMQQHTIV